MSKNNAKILHEFCVKFNGPRKFTEFGVRVSHFKPQDPPCSAPEPYQCTPRNCIIATNINFCLSGSFFLLLCFYQLKFGYTTWIFCQIVRAGKGVLHSKAFVHIILTSDSSARDKNAYQVPTQINRAGIERKSASHFCFTKVLPCTQERLEEWDWYILSKQT